MRKIHCDASPPLKDLFGLARETCAAANKCTLDCLKALDFRFNFVSYSQFLRVTFGDPYYKRVSSTNEDFE